MCLFVACARGLVDMAQLDVASTEVEMASEVDMASNWALLASSMSGAAGVVDLSSSASNIANGGGWVRMA